jgi:uncharacterized protein DUF2786
MNRENIIDKIRKLRALAGNNSSIEEIATATKLAEELLQKYQIEEAEFEVAHGSQEQAIFDQIALTDWKERQTLWQNILLTTLSEAYNCEGILLRRNHRLGYYVIGRPADILTIRYQYSYFTLELTRLAQLLAPNNLGRGSGKHWHKSFYLGAVSAIADSLKKAKVEVRASANSSALAIIDRHAEEALALKNKLHPNVGGAKAIRTTMDRNAYDLGYQSGSNLSPKPGLGSNVRGLLGT